MITISKLELYLEIIEKTNETFREFLEHISEESLDWSIQEFLSPVRSVIEHILQDQMWIVNYILEKKELKYKTPKNFSSLSLKDIVNVYDEMISEINKKLKSLENLSLDDERDYKGVQMSIEDWIFEYIHHMNKHCGELNVYHLGWKRKERALKD